MRLFAVAIFLGLCFSKTGKAQVPDSLDPSGYFPLHVGNSWEYVHELYRPATQDRATDESETRLERYRIIDSLSTNPPTYYIEFVERTGANLHLLRDTVAVQFNSSTGSIEGDNLPGILSWLRCIDSDFQPSSPPSDCHPFVQPDSVFMPDLFGSQRVVTKSFGSFTFGFMTAHNVGVLFGGGGCEPCSPLDDRDDWTLKFAKVNNNQFGTVILGVEEVELLNDDPTSIIAFPNPARDHIRFIAPVGASIEIYTISGRLLMSIPVRAPDSTTLSLAEFRRGVYLARAGSSSVTFIVH